jgi:acetyl-CoA carboxylase carboxyl transferase subunit alpha
MKADMESLDAIDARIAELSDLHTGGDASFDSEIAELQRKRDRMLKAIHSTGLTPWETVQLARHAERPVLRDYIAGLFDDFIELHGDRCFGDDRALLGGFARIGEQRVMLLGMEKGRDVDAKVTANFGMPNPEGYRKALRLMRLAEKYGLPVLCLIDTPAAYPGREAEERGQAEAIARNLTEMAVLETPIVVVITGEGGSGGALGIAVGDVILMLQNAIYSVIPPEGCAAILWRDSARAPEAADALKLTAGSLLDLGIIDGIVREPLGGAHRDPEAVYSALRDAVLPHLARLCKVAPRKLVDQRFDKFVRMGKTTRRKYAAH